MKIPKDEARNTTTAMQRKVKSSSASFSSGDLLARMMKMKKVLMTKGNARDAMLRENPFFVS